METNIEWRNLLAGILLGWESAPRGMLIKEKLANQTTIDMHWPCVTVPERKISRKFQFAEAAWILSGDNRVSSIAPYNKNISPYADDGQRYFGAYGPKIVDQLPYVVAKLMQDSDSRQAVINIWRENPPVTKDVPCTISMQFLIRNGQLHCVTTMRSSDAWLGWPYDVFNFSMVARAVIIYMRSLGYSKPLELGTLILTAGLQHLYQQHWEKAREIAKESEPLNEEAGCRVIFPIKAFESVDHFVETLWRAASDVR